MSEPEPNACEALASADGYATALLDTVRALAREVESAGREQRSALRETAQRVSAEAHEACLAVAHELRRSAWPTAALAADLEARAEGAVASDSDVASGSHGSGSPSPGALDLLPRLERMASATPRHDLEELLGIVESVLAASPPSAAPEPPSGDFSRAGLRALAQAGIDVDVDASGHADSSQAAYTRLLAEALTTEEAARRLGVDATRVYQRLADRTLYGVRLGRRWRLPAFQFTDEGEVSGIGAVLAALPDALHPLAVAGWFATPQEDLRPTDAAAAQTPREWLLSGGDPRVTVELATGLGVPR